ncbi:MAG: guanosine-3',5'-bis(diphosphate) 3'-pyrophosphohydrolase [bacterium]|jgi:guanosine-3',5'-bis(diphosphate) 3'-pyrophosphohydrolase
MIRIDHIIERYQKYSFNQEVTPIRKAYILAARANSIHKHSGKRQLQHATEVASVLTDLHFDIHCIVSSLLLGIYEDHDISIKEVRELMGIETANILTNLAKLEQISQNTTEEGRIAEHMRETMLATSKDIRVIFVTLADRLVMMRHLKEYVKENILEYARETLNIYAPIANRLGLSPLKTELENLSFEILFVKEFQEVRSFCEKKEVEQGSVLENLHNEISLLLEKNKISANVKERRKSYYSIFSKARNNDLTYDHVYDLVATRILVKTKDECYFVLGLIHEDYNLIDGKFKDYISSPKANGYKSLHTSVISDKGMVFEVQIRTEEMDHIAEFGVAAHWSYKERNFEQQKIDENLNWIRELTQKVLSVSDPKESLELFTREFYSDSVYAFTPLGKIIKLPINASVIDFAYMIHTDVGHNCVSAEINGKRVPIRTVIENGDKIEIFTQKKQTPTKDWLNWVVTSKALQSIKQKLKEDLKDSSERIGKEMIAKEAKSLGLTLSQLEDNLDFKQLYRSRGYSQLKNYYVAIGRDKEDSREVHHQLRSKFPVRKTLKEKFAEVFPSRSETLERTNIIGFENVRTRFASCCKPVKGDQLVGVITKGQFLSVHVKGCENLDQYDSHQWIEMEWSKSLPRPSPIKIHLEYEGNIKTSLSVMKVLASAKVNLLESIIKNEGKKTKQDCIFKVEESGMTEKILKKLNQLKFVSAHRVEENTILV